MAKYKKYIRIEKGDYRNNNMSGRVFPIVKDYQDHSNKPGGFVTVDTSQLAGFDGARLLAGLPAAAALVCCRDCPPPP